MSSVSLERIADALYQPRKRTDSTCYGSVVSVNSDGSFQVRLNASTTARCVNLCTADVGDRVLVLMQANGSCVAVGRVGGDSGGGGGDSHTYALGGAGTTVKLTRDGGSAGNAGTYEIPIATQSSAGTMSSTDKGKLDGIEAHANDYEHPSHTAHALGLYKFVNDAEGHVSSASAVQKSDITALGIPAEDTTYTDATQSASGLMSSTDKTKLDGIADGATANVGTVTSVTAGTGLTGGTITESGTIAHSTAAGYKHIPSGGSSNQYLRYSSSGTAAWQTPDSAPTASSSKLATSGGIKTALDGKADATHSHSASDITSGTLPVANGGTGADNATDARANLGVSVTQTLTSGTEIGSVCGTKLYAPSGSGPVSTTPTGTISMFGGSSAPSGWLLCQGQAVSRSTYADLFAVIGTTYGGGNGSTTFNLPNMQGRFALGKSSAHALASTGGAETVTLSSNEIPAHTHGNKSLTGWAEAYGDTGIVGASGGVTGVFGKGSSNLGYGPDYNGSYAGYRLTIDASHEHDSVGGGGAHENMPPYQTVNYIIKT